VTLAFALRSSIGCEDRAEIGIGNDGKYCEELARQFLTHGVGDWL
jgi:hypothetical protein